MKCNKYHIIAVLLFMLPILASCRQDLCYNHFPRLSVSLDWECEWERDYGMSHATQWDSDYHGIEYHQLKPGIPEWVNIIRYGDDGSVDENFISPSGGDVNVGQGVNTSFLLYNGDTEYIVLTDMASLPTAQASATLRSRSTLLSSSVTLRHPDARTTNPPDVLFATYIKDAPETKNHQTTIMSVKMQPLVYTYVIHYEIEKGLQHVSLARGALGGMAESVYLRDGVTSDESVIVLYDCDKEPGGVVAHVRTFGVPGFPDEYYGRLKGVLTADQRPYTLNLELLLNNGKMLEYNFDISDQMKNQPRGGVIKVSGISIDDIDASYESGFEVDVSDWGPNEDIDLPVSAK